MDKYSYSGEPGQGVGPLGECTNDDIVDSDDLSDRCTVSVCL